MSTPTTALPAAVGAPAPGGRLRSDGRRLHRWVGGLSLIGAPLALLASEVTNRGSEKPAQLVSDAAHHSGAIAASNVFILLSSALLVPAAFAVLHVVRGRGRRLTEAGTALAVLGALGHAAFAGFTAVVLSTPQGNRAEMVALLDRVNHNAALAPIAVCILAFALCAPLLLVGAWRSGLVPLAVPMAAVLAVLVEFAHVDGMAGGVTKEALAVVALGWTGIQVLRLSDDAWRPAAARG